MTLSVVVSPYQPINGLTGLGLNDGAMYIGVDGQDPETYPQDCFWDATGLIPAAQPIQILGGYPMRLGTPTRLYTAATFSIRVRDASGAQVFYEARAVATANVAGLYNTRALAAAAVIPSSQQITGLQTLGFYASGDKGGAHYKYATVQGAGPGRFQSADGAWWELAEPVPNVRMFGAKADGTDDSAALQDALNYTLDVLLLSETYRAHGLTDSRDGQNIVAAGQAAIIKNANGDLFTSTHATVTVRNVKFSGDASVPVYTGNNVVSSGDNFHLINCGSRWAAARAVKATGGACHIIGTCDIYQTADATAGGYDIEVGRSGTATLYHQIHAIRSGQATGGLLLIDTGSHVLAGGAQIGKLTIQAGTLPAGVNGGMIVGARILGNVNIGISSAVFTACQFGAITVTVAASVANVSIDASNVWDVAAVLVNNGNENCPLVRQVSAGSKVTLRYGSDASHVDVSYVPTEPSMQVEGNIRVPFGKALKSRNEADSSDYSFATTFAGDNMLFGSDQANSVTVTSGAGGAYIGSTGVARVQVYDTYVRPQADNAMTLGQGSNRWSTVYAATGAINTSDERMKQDVAGIDDAALDAWAEVEFCQFRYRDAAQEKGDAARLHVGVIAQRVQDAFARHGLDPFRFGVLCYDAWDEHQVLDSVTEDGEQRWRTVQAGDRYSIRYDEALALEAALMRRELRAIKAKQAS